MAHLKKEIIALTVTEVCSICLSCFFFFVLGHAPANSDPNYFGAYLPLFIAVGCIFRLAYLATKGNFDSRTAESSAHHIFTTHKVTASAEIEYSAYEKLSSIAQDFRWAKMRDNQTPMKPFFAYIGLLAIRLIEGNALNADTEKAVQDAVGRQYGDVSPDEQLIARKYFNEILRGESPVLSFIG